MDKDISQRLVALRSEKGLTQAELAIEIEISNKVISKWERGICVPSVEVLLRLAEFYNMSLDELVDGRNIDNNKLSGYVENVQKPKRKLPICTPMIVFEIISILLLIVTTVIFAVKTNSYEDLIPIYDPDGVLVAMYEKPYAWTGYITAMILYVMMTLIQSLVKFRPRLSYIVDSIEIDRMLTNEVNVDKVCKMISTVVSLTKLIMIQYIMLMSWKILYSFPYVIWSVYIEIAAVLVVLLALWGMSVGYAFYLKKQETMASK